MRPNIKPAASKNAQRSAKYILSIFKNQNNQEIRPFRKTSESNDNSQQVLPFCDKQTSQCVRNVFFNYDKVNFRCRLSDKLQFVIVLV